MTYDPQPSSSCCHSGFTKFDNGAMYRCQNCGNPCNIGIFTCPTFTGKFNLKLDDKQTPLEQHTEAVTRVLDQRGEVYSPDTHHDRHAQARLYARVKAALYEELPEDLPAAAEYYIDMMAAKVSRSFESACAGIPNTDSPFDFAGYTELLTRLCRP